MNFKLHYKVIVDNPNYKKRLEYNIRLYPRLGTNGTKSARYFGRKITC